MNHSSRTRTFSWENPAHIAEQAKSLSGAEFLTGILQGNIPPPPIATTLSFQPISLDDGKIVFEFIPAEYHFNPIGSVHGGVISTLLDTVMGSALHYHLPQGVRYTTLELKINFIKAITLNAGRLIAEGRLMHQGKTTAIVEGDIKDESGKTLFAHGVSTCLILNKS